MIKVQIIPVELEGLRVRTFVENFVGYRTGMHEITLLRDSPGVVQNQVETYIGC